MEIADHQGNNEPACARSAFCTTRQAASRIGLLHRTLQMWVEDGACRMDGFGMIRSLRGNPATASMPMLVISGTDKPAVLALGLPDDLPCLTKPAPQLQRRSPGSLRPILHAHDQRDAERPAPNSRPPAAGRSPTP